jgi:hypothetical protein
MDPVTTGSASCAANSWRRQARGGLVCGGVLQCAHVRWAPVASSASVHLVVSRATPVASCVAGSYSGFECDGLLRRVQVRWAPAVRSVAVRLASRRWARWRPRPSGHLMCGRLYGDVAPRAEASCVVSFTTGSVKTSAQQRPHAR